MSETPSFESTAQPKWTRLPIRTRPHRNPLAENDDPHSDCPAEYLKDLSTEQGAWPPLQEGSCSTTASGASPQYPHPQFVDIGCAFGGMLFSLAPKFPSTYMLGLEIRTKVVNYAQEKSQGLRVAAKEEPQKFHHYNNVWFDQCNVMKFGVNCFQKGSVERMFFCHPDPHWKKANLRRRIIGPGLVHNYAHWMKIGGLIYTCSDVPELEQWMIQCLDECPLFERISQQEIDERFSAFEKEVLNIVISTSEDAQRAERKKLAKNYAIHRRIPYRPSGESSSFIALHATPPPAPPPAGTNNNSSPLQCSTAEQGVGGMSV